MQTEKNERGFFGRAFDRAKNIVGRGVNLVGRGVNVVKNNRFVVAGMAVLGFAVANPIAARATEGDPEVPASITSIITAIGVIRDNWIIFALVTLAASLGMSWLMQFRPKKK